MTDYTGTSPTDSTVPKFVRTAIERLWRLSVSSELHIHQAPEFRSLEDACRSYYLPLDHSRLGPPPSLGATPDLLRRALQNFFRWNGAPWFSGRHASAEAAAVILHRAFLRQSIRRTYLVPLDRLFLKDRSSGSMQEATSIRFGPNEVARLSGAELERRAPLHALARFGAKYECRIAKLDGFCWLATSCIEPAGPVERRTWLNVLNASSASVGTVGLYRPTYPTPVENALFVLLLTFVKDSRDALWRPFHVPWVFSFTDDPFSDAITPPDHSTLSRDIVGDEHDYFEVPDRSEVFEFGEQRRQALQDRWRDLETVLARAGTRDANFHPLTRHFFVKALSQRGVDEIISNLSCLEATLQLKGDRNRRALQRRFAHLVGDDDAAQWLSDSYRLRDDYLHSLAEPRGDSDMGRLGPRQVTGHDGGRALSRFRNWTTRT